MENTETGPRIFPFAEAIDNFIDHINALWETMPLMSHVILGKAVSELRDFEKFRRDNNLEETTTENGESALLIPSEKFREFLRLENKVTTSAIAQKVFPVNTVVAFVSQYDAYLGSLTKTVFLTRPELLNSSERSIQFNNLLEFRSLEEAREFVLEKEVESMLRLSHEDQFTWLERKLNMKLMAGLPNFTHFIEITERRNLFVHCNGIVSRQYLSICKKHNVPKIEEIQIGHELVASPKYLSRCYSVLFEIGIKLGHVLWRKLLPSEMEFADQHLNNLCVNLMTRGHDKLAINLLSFATEVLKSHHNQEMTCIFTINKALAYHLKGDQSECLRIVTGYDWSATSNIFKLAIAILEEKYQDAIQLMEAIGDKDEKVDKIAYMEWPLFKIFRETKEFQAAYSRIFKEDFIHIPERRHTLSDIAKEINDIEERFKETNEVKVSDLFVTEEDSKRE